jgi:two-component system chemotaxis response regulator CheB
VPQLDVIVIGASAGGVASLQRLAERLPASLPASVFVTLHLPEGIRSSLPRIMERAGPVPAAHAENGQLIEPGRIYIAPPGFHMTLERDRVRVTRGAREHGLRPAIDPLFRSAALAFGPRVIGVVLSGQLDDGTVGLAEIKRAGGVAVVQDPDETAFQSMPKSAIAHVNVDYILPADEIGTMLEHLVLEEETADRAPDHRASIARREPLNGVGAVER